MSDSEFLQWIHDRLHKKHGENVNFDYMHRFRKIILNTPSSFDKCGCGKPVRYSMPNALDAPGSCNKFTRCPTHEELQVTLRSANTCLMAYQHTVNRLDDYFEYANESKKDQKKVHQILSDLTDTLAKL